MLTWQPMVGGYDIAMQSTTADDFEGVLQVKRESSLGLYEHN
jgi:hypothetical protein